jgi:hypothetical protein
MITLSGSEAFVDGFADKERIDIANLLARPAAVVHTATRQVVVLGFGSVLPPSIYA